MSRNPRRNLFVAAAAALLLAFVTATLLYVNDQAQRSQQAVAQNRPALSNEQSPSFGKADAKVRIVEFFDPACETCAAFFPQVKKLLAAHPDQIRLELRHVPFHKGADLVVKALEAARLQNRYLPTLEALYAAQDRWVVHHEVRADSVWPVLAGVGLDIDRLRKDMEAPDIARRIERDMADARSLGVTKTPEFFVNGRPLPSFGLEQLLGLVDEELRRAYP